MDDVKLWLLDFFYPNVCDCCGQRIAYDKKICADCEKSLVELEVTAAQWQTGKVVPWDGLAVAYSYESTAKNGVLAMKDGKRGFLEVVADRLVAQAKASLPIADCSCLVFVPMTKRRRRMQGYGHTELLANAIGKRLSLPVCGDFLEEQAVGRFRQHNLSAADRTIYAQRFVHTGQSLAGQSVLLCDDILTTGSTLMYCTNLLKECGAAHVYVLAAACRILSEKDVSSIE